MVNKLLSTLTVAVTMASTSPANALFVDMFGCTSEGDCVTYLRAKGYNDTRTERLDGTVEYIIGVKRGESLNDVLSLIKVRNPETTLDALAEQNGLNQSMDISGKTIKYVVEPVCK